MTIPNEAWRQLGEIICHRMHELELSCHELATSSQVSPEVLRNLRNGRELQYHPDTIARVAAGLGWTPGILYRTLAEVTPYPQDVTPTAAA